MKPLYFLGISYVFCGTFLISNDDITQKNNKDALHEHKEKDLEIQQAKDFLISFLKKINKIAKGADKNHDVIVEFARHMIESLNEEEMAKFILGKYLKDMSNEDKKEFQKELTYYFTTYGTKKNVDLFASVDMEHENFSFKEDINLEKGRFSFEKEFKTTEKPVRVKMVVLKTNTSEYKIFDIVLEDISLLITTRDYIKNLWANINDGKSFLKVFKASTDDYLKKVLKDYPMPDKLQESLRKMVDSHLK